MVVDNSCKWPVRPPISRAPKGLWYKRDVPIARAAGDNPPHSRMVETTRICALAMTTAGSKEQGYEATFIQLKRR